MERAARAPALRFLNMYRELASVLLIAPFTLLNIRQNQKLKRDEIITLQSKKLRRLVKHSFEEVPYYHKLFRASGARYIYYFPCPFPPL